MNLKNEDMNEKNKELTKQCMNLKAKNQEFFKICLELNEKNAELSQKWEEMK
jgi:hypothetical protein